MYEMEEKAEKVKEERLGRLGEVKNKNETQAKSR